MTTINTIHDLHRILLDHPEWQSELRNILLTEELLALPKSVDRLTKNVDKLSRAIGTLRENTEARFDQTDARFDRTDARFDRMGNDIRNFRGNFVSDAVRRHPADIALALSESRSLSLDETTVKVLSPEEIMSLARAYGSERLSEIPSSERRSFYRTDLIMSVHTADGDICYIVLQGSYTCDERDTDRAITSARLMRQFTGSEAWPAVAGVRLDNRIRTLIESGEIFWHRTEEVEPPPAE